MKTRPRPLACVSIRGDVRPFNDSHDTSDVNGAVGVDDSNIGRGTGDAGMDGQLDVAASLVDDEGVGAQGVEDAGGTAAGRGNRSPNSRSS